MAGALSRKRTPGLFLMTDMKYRHLNTVLAVLAFSANCGAEVIKPQPSYSEDFSFSFNNGDILPEGWVTYGRHYRPSSPWDELFGSDGTGPSFRLLNTAGCKGAFSNSSFLEDISADEWLVTPPIHINSDEELLVMTIAAYGSYKLNNYRVFISDKGNSKEDFDTEPIIVSSLYGAADSPCHKKSSATISGYSGKDVYLAFVNRSKDASLLGVTDINISTYIMDVIDETPLVVPADETFQVSLSTSTYTSSYTKGITAVLETSGGVTSTLQFDKTILPTGTPIAITFPDIIEMSSDNVEYKVTITPNFEGAEPTVVTGRVTQPYTTYPPVAVIEEFTGTWCTFCPRGAAFMDYYHDKYSGGENGKVIGIALHSGDVMEIPDKSYLNTAQKEADSDSYPSAFFSRSTVADPGTENIVKSLLSEKFYSSIQIDKVMFNHEEDDLIQVDFKIENAYSKSELEQRVALVVVENNVRGETPEYNQTNYFSGVPKATIEATYGKELWPYFEFFSKSPNPVPFTKMEYQHVARGIYPDYYGALLEGPCETGTPISFSFSFPKPENVLNWDNISVIAILIDSRTGKIIYGDEMEASLFNNDSGIEDIYGDSIDADCMITVNGNLLNIKGASAMTVEILGIDGIVKGSFHSESSEIEIPAEPFKGTVIVRVRTADGIFIKKIIL